MNVRELTAEDVDFVVECEPEHIPYVGNCSAWDDETDREQEELIRSQLESGNEWAWCCVKVTAKWGDFEESDYLGGCSYRSREDFVEPGGYYDDMKDRALEELNASVARCAEQLEQLEN